KACFGSRLSLRRWASSAAATCRTAKRPLLCDGADQARRELERGSALVTDVHRHLISNLGRVERHAGVDRDLAEQCRGNFHGLDELRLVADLDVRHARV